MGATINPMFASLYSGSLVPGGMNPTGNQLSLSGGTSGTASGANPLLPSTTPSAAAPVTTNPYSVVPSTTSSTLTANTGPYPSSTNLGAPGGTNGTQFGGFLSGMTQTDISRLFGSLKKTYGDGMAHLILDFLQGGAGFNQQAINNLLASLQPGIERGEENIMEQFSAMGNRFGSPAGIGLGDYLSQVNLNEGQLVTQMYEQSLNDFMNVMMGAAGTDAKRIASSPSFMDQLGSILGLVPGGAGAASGIISAINPSADTGILDAIAAAGAI